MNNVLADLTSTKTARVRDKEPAFVLTEHLIRQLARVYAKIAWRHGFEVVVQISLVPPQCIPAIPTAKYDDEIPVFGAFEGSEAQSS